MDRIRSHKALRGAAAAGALLATLALHGTAAASTPLDSDHDARRRAAT